MEADLSQDRLSCPICGDTEVGCQGASVAGGYIHRCHSCRGFFLFPFVDIEYSGSHWTRDRRESWGGDCQRGRLHAPRILEYSARYLVKRPESVLEVGCGTGFMSKGFVEHGCSYTGLDVDTQSIEFAVSEGVHAIEVKAEELRTALSGEYDIVLSSNVLEHVDDPVLTLKNIGEVCSGVAIVIVPNADGLFSRLRGSAAVEYIIRMVSGNDRRVVRSMDGSWHKIAYCADTLRYICNVVGLEVLELKTIGINDHVFGFVQPNSTWRYKLAEMVARWCRADTELLLVCRKRASTRIE